MLVETVGTRAEESFIGRVQGGEAGAILRLAQDSASGPLPAGGTEAESRKRKRSATPEGRAVSNSNLATGSREPPSGSQGLRVPTLHSTRNSAEMLGWAYMVRTH